MRFVALAGGVVLIVAMLLDAFETIVLPRRISRRVRLTRLFYTATWAAWSVVPRRRRRPIGPREEYLSFYGPFSLILLLMIWAALLIIGYALLQWGLGTKLSTPAGTVGFGADLYFSGTTFFTLGLGDVSPQTSLARVVAVVEAATGFGLLGLVIGYLPVLYQSFARREVTIALLDARAGSPPTGVELLRRYGLAGRTEAMEPLFLEFERWSAELLESHLSHPELMFFRSQHDNQSWVAALTAVLDACALVIAGVEGVPEGPARLAFAMARHAAGDLRQVMRPRPRHSDRWSSADLERLRAALADAGLSLRTGAEVETRLAGLRALYEPDVAALAEAVMMPLPPWLPPAASGENWRLPGDLRP